MNALYKFTLSLIVAVGIVSCGGEVDEEALQLINNGNFSQAEKLLVKSYDKNPDNGLVNGLLAEVLTHKCLQEKCATERSGRALLTRIREHLSNYIYEQERSPEKLTRPVFENIVEKATRQAVEDKNPLILKNFVSLGIPQNIPKDKLTKTLFNDISQALKTGSNTLSNAFIKIATDNALTNSPEHTVGKFFSALIEGRTKTAESLARTLNAKLNTGQMPDIFFVNLPYVMVYYALEKDEIKGASLFLKSFKSLTEEVGLKYLEKGTNAKKLASSFNNASKSRSFVNLLRNKLDTSEWWESESVRLALTRISLSLNYDFEALWNRYIKTLLYTDEQPDDFLRMYDGFDLTKLSAQQIILNNEQLLAHAESKMLNGDVLVALFKQILYRADANPEAFNKRVVALLSDRVALALDSQQYEDLMAYLEFDKELIKGKREEFIKVFQNGINQAWEKEDFKRIPILNELITKTLGVKYNLDKDLISRFEKAFDDPEVQIFYNADQISDFHQKPTEMERTNNPKVAYVLDHFKERPELIQRLLKKVSLEQPSTYGPALFVLRMYDFFPKGERLTLVENALRSGLRKDNISTAVEILEEGRELRKYYSNIQERFIVTEAVKRLDSLEEHQDFWESATASEKKVVEVAYPQNYSLMRALDEYDNGQVRDAMNRLKNISDKALLKIAEPYFKEFSKLFKPFYGSYVFTSADDNMRAFKVILSESKVNLKLNVTLENLIGTIFKEKNYQKDWGQTSSYTVTAEADPKDFKLTLGYTSRIQPKKNFSFERSFGFIESFLINEDGSLTAVLDTGKKYKGIRYAREDEENTPHKTYTAQAQQEDLTYFEDAAYILPKGSTFSISKAANAPKESKIYTLIIKKPHHKNTYEALINLNAQDQFSIQYDYMYKQTAYQAQLNCQLAGMYINCGAHNQHWNTDKYRQRILLKANK